MIVGQFIPEIGSKISKTHFLLSSCGTLYNSKKNEKDACVSSSIYCTQQRDNGDDLSRSRLRGASHER